MYIKVAYRSNMDEQFESSRKPDGTMLGVTGQWESKVERTGSDDMGRWSWAELRGKRGKMIKVISAYRVSQATTANAGELTSCKQQVRSMLKRGI